MVAQSRLHVPKTPARPGDAPDFSYLKLSPAGKIARPDATAPALETRFLSEGLVRVLDDEHRAVGPWNPHLDAAELQVGLRHMLLTRVYDDRMQRIQRSGKISFYMRSLGEEAVVGRDGDGAATRRTCCFRRIATRACYFVRGRPLVDLMCQLLSNTRDMCKGRQLPVMYHWRDGNIFSISGNLATQFPQAVGWAMAAAIKGEDAHRGELAGRGLERRGGFPPRAGLRVRCTRRP